MDKVNTDTRSLRFNVHRLFTNPWIPMTFYTSAIGIAEFVLYYVSMPGGMASYFVILIVLILHSTLEQNEAQRNLWLVIGIVPLIRIVSTVILTMGLVTITLYVFIGVPVFIGIYTMVRYLKYSIHDSGLNSRHFGSQILIAITGIGLGTIDYVILKPEPLIEGSFVQFIFPGVVLLIFSGLMEELAFRGVMQRAAGALGSWGWVIIALIYALLQIGHGSLLHLVFTLGVSIFFGFVVLRTKSVLGVSLAHGVLNIMLFLVMPNIV